MMQQPKADLSSESPQKAESSAGDDSLKIATPLRSRASAVSLEDAQAKLAVQENLRIKIETQSSIIESLKAENERLHNDSEKKDKIMKEELESKDSIIETLSSIIESQKAEIKKLHKELEERDKMIEDPMSHIPQEYCEKTLNALLLTKKEKSLQLLEQLSDTNEKYYEMTSRKKEDLKKQQVQGDYELVILDRMSRKQTLESLEKNIQDAEQWLRRLECELVSLEDECIAIESTLCSLRKLQDTENDGDKMLHDLVERGPVSERVKELVILESKEWFWSHLTRSESMVLMNSDSIPSGSFLIRKSEAYPGSYVLQVKLKNVNPLLIKKLENGQYGFSEEGSVSFSTIEELVEFYRENPMTEFLPGEVKLLKSIPKPKPQLPICILRDQIVGLEKQINNQRNEEDIKLSTPHSNCINGPKTFSEKFILPEKLPPLSMKILTDFIPDMAPDWEMLGCKLGMETTVAKLRDSEKDADKKCLQMLQEWLNHINASWRVLLEALFAIGLEFLAVELVKKLNENSSFARVM